MMVLKLYFQANLAPKEIIGYFCYISLEVLKKSLASIPQMIHPKSQGDIASISSSKTYMIQNKNSESSPTRPFKVGHDGLSTRHIVITESIIVTDVT